MLESDLVLETLFEMLGLLLKNTFFSKSTFLQMLENVLNTSSTFESACAGTLQSVDEPNTHTHTMLTCSSYISRNQPDKGTPHTDYIEPVACASDLTASAELEGEKDSEKRLV